MDNQFQPARIALVFDWTLGHERQMFAGSRRFLEGDENIEIATNRDGVPYVDYKRVLELSYDGIIGKINNQELYLNLLDSGKPLILLEPNFIPDPIPENVHIVATDGIECGRIAGSLYFNRGIRNLAYYNYDANTSVLEKSKGFKSIARQKSLNYHGLGTQEMHQWSRRKRERTLIQELKALPKPCGIFAARDYRAIEIIEACRIAGIPIPEEIAIIGGDGETNIKELYGGFLSAIQPNYPKIGYIGAKTLMDILKGKKLRSPYNVIAPLGLDTGNSTDIWAIDDPYVSKALQILEKRAYSSITVDDIARECSCSQRLLSMRFRDALDRSPYAELLRLRLERAKNLLSNAQWSIKEISSLVGFNEQRELTMLFKNKLQMTPTEYRARHRLG